MTAIFFLPAFCTRWRAPNGPCTRFGAADCAVDELYVPPTATTFGSEASFVAACAAICGRLWSSSGWKTRRYPGTVQFSFAWSIARSAEFRIPMPNAETPPDVGAIIPMTSVPLLVSQDEPPAASPSERFVPHAESRAAATRTTPVAATAYLRLIAVASPITSRIGRGARPRRDAKRVNSFGRPTQMATTATPKGVVRDYPERGIWD